MFVLINNKKMIASIMLLWSLEPNIITLLLLVFFELDTHRFEAQVLLQQEILDNTHMYFQLNHIFIRGKVI